MIFSSRFCCTLNSTVNEPVYDLKFLKQMEKIELERATKKKDRALAMHELDKVDIQGLRKELNKCQVSKGKNG